MNESLEISRIEGKAAHGDPLSLTVHPKLLNLSCWGPACSLGNFALEPFPPFNPNSGSSHYSIHPGSSQLVLQCQFISATAIVITRSSPSNVT